MFGCGTNAGGGQAGGSGAAGTAGAAGGNTPVAADLGCTLAQLAIAWCLKNPNVSTVITGASRVGQVRENLLALEVLPKLVPDVMARIDAITAAGASR